MQNLMKNPIYGQKMGIFGKKVNFGQENLG